MGVAEDVLFEVLVVDVFEERDFTALMTFISIHIDFSVLQLMRYNRTIAGYIMLMV